MRWKIERGSLLLDSDVEGRIWRAYALFQQRIIKCRKY